MQRLRHRAEKLVEKSFWTLSIVAVISLAPSSGLITLTIPDEPYGAMASIPDTPHISKRASEDHHDVSYDAAANSFRIPLPFLTSADIYSPAGERAHEDTLSDAQIRGPPTS